MMKFNKKTFELEFVDPLVCFCDGGGDSGGDEPDGVTFTSGDDYKAGDGVKISSQTLAQGSEKDTYAGRNDSRAALGIFAAADPFSGGNANARSAASQQAAQFAASGGNDFTGGNVGQAVAQAFAAPRPQARVERRPIDTSAANFVKMLAPSYMSQQAADQIAMNDANMVLPQEMYFDEKSGTYKRGADPSLEPENLAKTAADIATGNKDSYGIGAAGEFSADTARAGITNTGLTDQQMFNNIIASSEGVDQDSEVVSALSDNFLDQRGRDDLNALAGDAVDYFNNPIVKGGQFVEGLLGSSNDMGGKTRTESMFTTDAGLPRFGSVGDMQIGIQQGGRLMYDDNGNPDYVVMPDGSIIGANTGSGFTGSGDDQPIQPQMNPITNQPRCPEGYSFDESVGACMPDSSERRGPISDFPANPDMFVRMTALDRAPTNVPSGFNFDAANRRFQESYAYRPQYYGRTPMDLTGFTKLR